VEERNKKTPNKFCIRIVYGNGTNSSYIQGCLFVIIVHKTDRFITEVSSLKE
jgi:hypothetical protein